MRSLQVQGKIRSRASSEGASRRLTMTVFSTILCDVRFAVFALIRECIWRVPLARSAATATAATATSCETRARSLGQELVLANLALTLRCVRQFER